MRQALSLLLAGVVAALLALVSPGAAQPASQQIRLTEKQVLGFIAAQPDMTALIRKTQGLAGDRPSQPRKNRRKQRRTAATVRRFFSACDGLPPATTVRRNLTTARRTRR